MLSISPDNCHELVSEDRVHRTIYTSPQVFDLEMERIYEKSWVYVAHETEIPQPGDYKSTYIGVQPVIITRGADDGQIYGLLNSCRHRGATVCQYEAGNANFFRCNYHGWTYNNTGKLTGVPFRKGFGEDFDASKLGLIPVARIENYAGFIFASLSKGVPSLKEYLGRAVEHLSPFAADGPHPMSLRNGVMKYQYRCNWKFAAENAVDGYHPDFSHHDWLDMEAERRGNKFTVSGNTESSVRMFPHGHSLLDFTGFGGNINSYQFGNLLMFPNVVFLGIQIRVLRPIAPDLTEVSFYATRLADNTDAENAKMLRRFVEIHGPAGHALPDDVEMHERCQDGVKVKANEWLPFGRGLHNEVIDEGDGVYRVLDSSDEAPNRNFYKEWKRLMAQSKESQTSSPTELATVGS